MTPAAQSGFRPMLLEVHASTDILNPEEELCITCWWQNVGDAPADGPVEAFLDAEFGHQRYLETNPRYHRVLAECFPPPHRWQGGEVHAMTFRWRPAKLWGGTYHLHVGFCRDAEAGRGGVPLHDGSARTAIGAVEMAWGIGIPAVEDARKPWTREFHQPLPPPATRPVATTPLRIADEVAVSLAADAPAVLAIGDGSSEFAIPFAAPEAVLRERPTDRLIHSCAPEAELACDLASASATQVDYACRLLVRGATAADWTLRFAVAARRLTVTLDEVREADGFELLEVLLPRLAAAGGPDAHLVDFYAGGRLVRVADAAPVGHVHLYDVRNAAAVFTTDGTLVVESDRLDDKLLAAVEQTPAGKSAVLGVVLTHRVRAFGVLESIRVLHAPQVTIDLLDASWGQPSWQAVARFLRRDLKRNPHFDRYRRAMVYKQHVTVGPAPRPEQIREDSPATVHNQTRTRTFEQIGQVMRRVHQLLDGGPQVLYVVGWQCDGFDTGYPYVLETDPRAGTPVQLRELLAQGPKHNALVGMHDNYDDCYAGPRLPAGVVALDERGDWWKGWVWAGGQSYILGIRKYVRSGLMAQRVADTVRLFGLSKTYHLDVLSSEVRHYDFDPDRPAAADANHEAKLEIVAEFAKHDVDVTSESLTHPFVGTVGWCWSTRDNPTPVLFPTDPAGSGGSPAERYVPLTSMVYHGTVAYNGGRGPRDRDVLTAILRGTGGGWTESYDGGDERENLKWYYLVTLPMGLLADRQMLDVREDGSTVEVDYGDDCSTRVDFAANTYEIRYRGRVVGKDFTTFAPGFREGSYLAYCAREGTMDYPAPDGWTDGPLHVTVLTGDCVSAGARVQNGMVALSIPPGLPVRVSPEPEVRGSA